MSERDTERVESEAPPEVGAPVEEYSPDQYWEDEPDELPPRPRRRLFTRLTGALLGVLLLASGFVAGVLIEKGQSSGGTAASPVAGRGGNGSAAAARRAGGGGAGFAGGQGGGGGTTGQVSTLRGSTLYVQDDQGNTIKVTLAKGASVSRTNGSSVRAIHPGDTVVVQGTQAGDGSISASSIRATAASLGSGALAQLFGGQSGGAGQAGGTGGRSAGTSGGGSGPPGGG
ncbi:MAG: hypothetical protein QOK04_1147 [Solirubrobacteraceae bacterium]|nr:hypothetical protein [Solirubrobacteraceae bacterium]